MAQVEFDEPWENIRSMSRSRRISIRETKENYNVPVDRTSKPLMWITVAISVIFIIGVIFSIYYFYIRDDNDIHKKTTNLLLTTSITGGILFVFILCMIIWLLYRNDENNKYAFPAKLRGNTYILVNREKLKAYDDVDLREKILTYYADSNEFKNSNRRMILENPQYGYDQKTKLTFFSMSPREFANASFAAEINRTPELYTPWSELVENIQKGYEVVPQVQQN